MKKISNKGFTLIELLATILIIGLVLGITTYGIIISVNKAKEKSTNLSLTSIKEAARIYSGELGEDSWKNISNYEDTYFCVTIEELINKGLLNKNANSIKNGGKLVDYVVVIKNKTTKVIEKEEILTEDNEGNLAYNICTGNIKNEVITSKTKIDNTTSYTDSVEINFTDAVFESEIKERYCEYGESSANMNNKGTITNKTCSLDGLVKNKNYYTRVCMVSQRESVSCSDTVTVTTKNIVAPNIAIDTNKNNSVIINYDNSNNNSNIKGEAFYYFKSTINGTSSIKVSTCSLYDNKYSCNNDSVNNITKNTWYRTTSKEISITYNTSGNITVTAETRDKSNNSNSSTKEFSLYKTTFNRGNADTIGGQTNNIELMCLANKGKTCSITSPSIEKSGYQVLGWNTSSSATTSSWNVNTLKSINSTEIYYPILKLNVVKINFKAKGGIVNEKNNFSQNGDSVYRNNKEYSVQINYTGNLDSDGLPNYNNSEYLNISKTGYSAVSGEEWICLSDNCKQETYDQKKAYLASDFCDASNGNCEVTLGVNWKRNIVTIKFSVNGGTLISGSPYSVDSNGIVTKNGKDLHKIYYNDTIMSTGLPDYDNKDYLNISKADSIAVSGAEWTCLSGNCIETTYNQNTNIYTASSFCDASGGDCTVTLGVNWEKYKIIDDYRCVGSDYYYVTFCRGDKCNYTRKNCEYDISGTLDWNDKTPTYCNNTTINGNRCVGSDKYHITTCTAAKCNYTSKNGVSSNGVIYDRCSLDTECVTTKEMKAMYVTASSGLNCRSGAGTSYGIVTSYACGTAIKVKTNPTDNWYYSTVDNCYASGNYLSETMPNCSGGSSGSDDFSGYLANCTCNIKSDCGTSGSNIKVWCDTTIKNSSGSGKKYMCVWQNASSSGGFNNSPKSMCW